MLNNQKKVTSIILSISVLLLISLSGCIVPDSKIIQDDEQYQKAPRDPCRFGPPLGRSRSRQTRGSSGAGRHVQERK